MKKIHRYSGLILMIFVIAHLINHLASIVGAQQHIDLMFDLRKVYRNVIIEIILLLAIAVQIFTGIKFFLVKRNTAQGFYPRLQIWSGLYLAVFFFIHLTAIFAGRLILHVDTNFYFGVAGLNTFPHLLFFIPYYSLAVLSFFGHLAAIHFNTSKKKLLGVTLSYQANILVAIGFIITILVLYGATNRFRGVIVPNQYKFLTDSRELQF